MGGKDAGKKSKENGVKTSPDESLGMSSTERILRRIGGRGGVRRVA